MANFEEELARQLGIAGYQVTQKRGAPSAATRKFYDFHEGTDYGTPAQTPVRPQFQGTYLGTMQDNTGYGTRAAVYNPQTNQTYYLSHLAQVANLKPGQTFNPGTVIAYTGGVPGTPGSGNTTGAHLDVVTKGGQEAPIYNYASALANNISTQANAQRNPQAILERAKQQYGARKVIAVSNSQSNLAQLAKKYKNSRIVKVTV